MTARGFSMDAPTKKSVGSDVWILKQDWKETLAEKRNGVILWAADATATFPVSCKFDSYSTKVDRSQVAPPLLNPPLLNRDLLEWDQRIPRGASCVNTRTITHPGFSSTSTLFGSLQETSAITATPQALPGRDIRTWAEELDDPMRHEKALREYLIHRAEVHDIVTEASNMRKDQEAARYDRGICQVAHHVGSQVMLYQKNTRKLERRRRGPFRISDYAGSHGKSFKPQQLNGRGLRDSFHGDRSKTFKPRSGYLADPSLPLLPQQQSIRKTRPRLYLRPPKPPTQQL